MNTIPFYKNPGETPLEALERYRKMKPEYAHVPMTYAGRLDPLAEGLLILLAGDECMKKDEYTKLPKEYEVEVLFGFATDTYDVLGIPESSLGTVFPENERGNIALGSLAQTDGASREIFQQENIRADESNISSEFSKIVTKFIGVYDQKYPPYSSRTVNGKPLWQWARERRLSEIEIPSHKVQVSNIEIKAVKEISGKTLHKKINEMIESVNGDFRQKEILEKWNEVLGTEVVPLGSPRSNLCENYHIATLTISCGSGTYVRVIANDIGTALGVPALALHIKRTKIGDFKI